MLLVDVVGELGAWWGTAQVAFVGGSLGNRGGQNMIEPAAYGAAVSFGPNTRNFRDIVAALFERDAAVVVADGEQLLAFVRNCLANPPKRPPAVSVPRAWFASSLGPRSGRSIAPAAGPRAECAPGRRRSPTPPREHLSHSSAQIDDMLLLAQNP